MGFRIEPTEYRLNFQDQRLNGLTVHARSVSIGRFMEIAGVSAAAAIGGITLTATAVARDPMLDALAEVIISWNLDDEKGEPAEPGYDALAAQEPWVIRELYRGWIEAVSGVSAPLPNGSSAGATSLEPSIPMDVPSESPSS